MNTLLISSAFGILWLALLFALCFVCVHVLRLARLGQTYRKSANKEPSKEEPPPKQEEKTPEPVYYIVEKKKRVKSSFTEPKRINFK